MLDGATVPVQELQFGSGRVYLRDLCGADERAVGGMTTPAVVAWLDRLLVDVPGALAAPGQAASLTASERDRVLAGIHQRAFGPRVGGSAPCTACGETYDLDFRLDELVQSVFADGTAREIHMPAGGRYRIPTGQDEAALANLPAARIPTALIARCRLDEGPPDDPDAVAAAMEAAAPLLDLELGAPCPECGTANQLHFSMQRWLISALQKERIRLLDEVHALARAYGWSLGEILSLTRGDRRALVALLERESVRGGAR